MSKTLKLVTILCVYKSYSEHTLDCSERAKIWTYPDGQSYTVFFYGKMRKTHVHPDMGPDFPSLSDYVFSANPHWFS